MSLMNKIRKLPRIIEHIYFRLLQNNKAANLLINNYIFPLEENEVSSLINKKSINISKNDYNEALNNDVLVQYKISKWQPHTKILEYLTSYKILNIKEGNTVLDAAGGYESEFVRFISLSKDNKIKVICQDANPSKIRNLPHNFECIQGSIDNIPLPDQSIDVITCHHSFEHFEDNLDTLFIKECLRLLSVNGQLLITPLFITNIYAEITNNVFKSKSDSKSKFFFDPTATFPGWGPMQGFARTYDNISLKERVLDFIPDNYEVCLYSIYFDDMLTPEFKYAYYQPKLNMSMKSLLIKRVC